MLSLVFGGHEFACVTSVVTVIIPKFVGDKLTM